MFDENISWYIDENLEKSSKDSPNTTDPEFYNSNVIYSKFTSTVDMDRVDHMFINRSAS